jgi:hypothetical protein
MAAADPGAFTMHLAGVTAASVFIAMCVAMSNTVMGPISIVRQRAGRALSH